jgi:ferredoxin-NADP reductase/nitrite reductase/ring-hydroxylating ferredoxin subunit
VKLAGIKINMSGCPSSCAQTYLGDIGLKGVRVRRKAGTCDGFDVFLGGGVHETVELAILYRKGVDTEQLPELIEELVRVYDQDSETDETFSQFWRRRLNTTRHFPFATAEEDYRPDVWLCERCGHKHAGEDPPVFCPHCSSLRKNFVRLDRDATSPTVGEAVPSAPLARADALVDVGAHADLVRDGRMAAKAGDNELALFLVGDEVHCTDGLCPHEGGPMSQGDVANGVVTCPWHGWTFRTRDGAPTDGNACALRTYPVKVEGGRLLVSIAGGVAPSAPPKVDEPEVALKVLDVIEETHDTRTVRLDNSEGKIAVHRPGQHIKVGVSGTWRSFTLSSPPTRPGVIEVTVKRNPDGVVSNAIHALEAGHTLTVKGPAGRYYFDPEAHREPLVLAVAGSGITPAMAILRTILDRQLDVPVTLLYGCRTRADVIFAREIDALRVRLATLRSVIVLSQPDADWPGAVGRVGPDLIAEHVADPASARYFLCGPGAMHDELTAWLLARGVPAERVHTEMFGKKRPVLAAAT